MILTHLVCWNILWLIHSNVMAADSLAPCVIRPSAAMTLTWYDQQVLAIYREGFIWTMWNDKKKSIHVFSQTNLESTELLFQHSIWYEDVIDIKYIQSGPKIHVAVHAMKPDTNAVNNIRKIHCHFIKIHFSQSAQPRVRISSVWFWIFHLMYRNHEILTVS